MQQDKDKELASSKRCHEHAREVREQVRKKEEERVTACKVFFEEGIKLDQEAKERSVAEGGREGVRAEEFQEDYGRTSLTATQLRETSVYWSKTISCVHFWYG